MLTLWRFIVGYVYIHVPQMKRLTSVLWDAVQKTVEIHFLVGQNRDDETDVVGLRQTLEFQWLNYM